MKLATTTGDFFAYTDSQLDAMRHIREAGFKYADYSFHNIDCRYKRGVFAPDNRGHIESVNALAEEIGLKFVQAHAPMGSPIAKDNAEFIKDTITCVKAASELGIPNVVVHSGYEMGLSKSETFIRNRDFFLPVIDAAAECGVNILVENFNKMIVPGLYWIDNATDLRELIEYVDRPNFHAVWDAGHANMTGACQRDELGILGKEVFALHVQDNFGNENEDLHLAPLCGNLDIDSLMTGLLDIGYNGYFTFEATLMLRTRSIGNGKVPVAPLSIRKKSEELLYEIGKHILTSYGVFEE